MSEKHRDKKDKKQSRKERERELRMLEREISGGTSLINYSQVHDRHKDDSRYERELEHKAQLEKQSTTGAKDGEKAPSATYDAFMRMQTGQGERTIADKINDPNRVTWEQFRKEYGSCVGLILEEAHDPSMASGLRQVGTYKDNEDRLDLPGQSQKKMAEYRKQLDQERESALSKGRDRVKARKMVSSSEGESDDDKDDGGDSAGEENGGGGRSKREKKKDKKKKDKKSKKHKKHKRHKKSERKRRRESDGGDESGGESSASRGEGGEGDSSSHKRRRREKEKEKEKEKASDPRMLSQYLQASSESE